MKILAIDIGAGTQDILLYDDSKNIENCIKLVLPSPHLLFAAKVNEATHRRQDLFIKGDIIGGGAFTVALKHHVEKGCRVCMTEKAAYTVRNSLDEVKALGIEIVQAQPESFRGETLEIMAPGVHIFSTMPDHTTFWNLFGFFKKNYDYMDGTSMACPHVSGVAAAFLSNRPDVTNKQLRFFLDKTADRLGDPLMYGHGRVDMWPFQD